MAAVETQQLQKQGTCSSHKTYCSSVEAAEASVCSRVTAAAASLMQQMIDVVQAALGSSVLCF